MIGNAVVVGVSCYECKHRRNVDPDQESQFNECLAPGVVALLDTSSGVPNSSASCTGAREFAAICGHMGRFYEAK